MFTMLEASQPESIIRLCYRLAMRVMVQALNGKSICLEMDVNDTILNMKTKLKEMEDTKANILLSHVEICKINFQMQP